ncbi:MAG: hypothetical protein ABSE55_17165 [Terracidiphilus sp.]|jgi:hypothetical protein
MLIEIWERLRGYDKWIQTEATVKSSEVEEIIEGFDTRAEALISTWHGYEELVWKDRFGTEWKKEVDARENSPLFRLYDGKSTIVCYNPASPEEFYVREQLQYKINLVSKIVAGVLTAAFVIVLLGLVLFHD